MRALADLSAVSRRRFLADLADVEADELDWRPTPHANTINLIVRHVRIDVEWHLQRLTTGEPGDAAGPASLAGTQEPPLDFEKNCGAIADITSRYVEALAGLTEAQLVERTRASYASYPPESVTAHFLGFHLALHLSGHGAQIRTLRNLFARAHGRRQRFFADNPTFPV